MDFSSQIQTISEEQLDQLFNSAPTELPKEEPKKEEGKKEEPIVRPQEKAGIEEIDVSTLDITGEEKKEEPKTEPVVAKVEEAKEEPKKEEPKVEEGTKEEGEDETEHINHVLKSTVDYLIDKGVWKDFDGRKDLKITEEAYAELALKQNQETAQEFFNELVDSTGDYGKAIFQHIRNGGNPDEIIDIFKEEKQLESFNLESERGQEEAVRKYYSEVVGWSQSKIEKYITTLKSEEDALKDESKEVTTKFDEIRTARLQKIQEEQAEKINEQKRLQREYIDKLTGTIDQSKDLNDKEKKVIKSSVLNYTKKLPNGTPVNELYYKIYQIQQDPKEYLEFIQFVIDRDGYKKKIQVAKDGETVQNTWKFVKNNNAVTKKATEVVDAPGKKVSTLDFSGLLKK